MMIAVERAQPLRVEKVFSQPIMLQGRSSRHNMGWFCCSWRAGESREWDMFGSECVQVAGWVEEKKKVKGGRAMDGECEQYQVYE
jgi:hypothetical protein